MNLSKRKMCKTNMGPPQVEYLPMDLAATRADTRRFHISHKSCFSFLEGNPEAEVITTYGGNLTFP